MSPSRAIRLLVIGDFRWHSGSSHVIKEYVRHGPSVGMEIAVSRDFGSHDAVITRHLPYTDEIGWATHALVVFEGNPFLSASDIERIDQVLPRARRVVIDADGHWGRQVVVDEDDNTWPCGSKGWHEQISQVADIVLQPSFGQQAPGAISFPYFGLPPRRRPRPTKLRRAQLDVQYIGNNWFRSTALLEVMSAARQALGPHARLGVRGRYWDGTARPGFESATSVDVELLRQLRVDSGLPVPFGRVITRMSDSLLTPVLVRPVLASLKFLIPRMLETLAADTLPIYRSDESYIGDIYNDNGALCLGDNPEDAIARVRRERAHLSQVSRDIYDRLSQKLAYPIVLTKLHGILARQDVSAS
jgi:hypothetical protein